MTIMKYTVVIVLLVMIQALARTSAKQNVTELYEQIFNGYNKRVRPKQNISEPTDVEIKCNIIKIQTLEEKSQVLIASFWFEVEWFDEFLIWNESAHDGVKEIFVSRNEIWLPDLVVYNDISLSSLNNNDFDIKVYPSGRVTWWPFGKYETSCLVDTTKYPFDVQQCKIIISPWYSDYNRMNLHYKSKLLDTQLLQINSEWDVLESHAVQSNSTTSDNKTYSFLTWVLRLKRKPKFFIINTILPVVLLAFLKNVCFLVPCESGEKIGLSVSLFITFSVILTLVGDSMPQTSEHTSVLAIYLAIEVLVSGITIFIQVISMRAFHSSKKVRVSRCLLKFLRHKIYCDKCINNARDPEDKNCFVGQEKAAIYLKDVVNYLNYLLFFGFLFMDLITCILLFSLLNS